jgi:predicted ABC-type ATPase
VAEDRRPACIYVLAGTNGAGKSSIAGATFRQQGVDYFNPDEVARLIRAATPGLSQQHANSAAWHEGTRLLARAIAGRLDFVFETTLGGDTITAMLEDALSAGVEVRVWYIGLRDPEMHVARVRARVAQGGHDIPETRIRERYDRSRLNLIRLLPKLTELRVYDNSTDADPSTGNAPRPMFVLHVARGAVQSACELSAVPHWAKPIVAAAMQLRR